MNKSSRDSASTLGDEVRRLKVSQQEIAEALGISQSQVSRVLAGKNVRNSKIAADIRSYLALRGRSVTPQQLLKHPELVEALIAVWDGTVAHGKALAGVIRSLGALEGHRRTRTTP